MKVTYGKGFEPARVETARDKAQRLEEAMMGMPQAECPVRHHFAPGVYAREISIPKGVVLVGAVHKIENLAVLSAGRLQVVTDEGTTEISAPAIVRVKPGQKNAALALEDAVWTNFFATDETDPDKLVEILTESKACEMLGGHGNRQLLAHEELNKLED